MYFKEFRHVFQCYVFNNHLFLDAIVRMELASRETTEKYTRREFKELIRYFYFLKYQKFSNFDFIN